MYIAGHFLTKAYLATPGRNIGIKRELNTDSNCRILTFFYISYKSGLVVRYFKHTSSTFLSDNNLFQRRSLTQYTVRNHT